MSILLRVLVRYQPGDRISQVLYGDKRDLVEALREDMLALEVPVTPLLRGTRDRDAKAVIKPERVFLAFERESFSGSSLHRRLLEVSKTSDVDPAIKEVMRRREIRSIGVEEIQLYSSSRKHTSRRATGPRSRELRRCRSRSRSNSRSPDGKEPSITDLESRLNASRENLATFRYKEASIIDQINRLRFPCSSDTDQDEADLNLVYIEIAREREKRMEVEDCLKDVQREIRFPGAGGEVVRNLRRVLDSLISLAHVEP